MSTYRDQAERSLEVADEIIRDGSREEEERYRIAGVIGSLAVAQALLAVDDSLKQLVRRTTRD